MRNQWQAGKVGSNKTLHQLEDFVINTPLSPLVSEFDSKDTEANHTLWLKRKIDTSRKSTNPLNSHDQVMSEARRVIESKRKKHFTTPLANPIEQSPTLKH